MGELCLFVYSNYKNVMNQNDHYQILLNLTVFFSLKSIRETILSP